MQSGTQLWIRWLGDARFYVDPEPVGTFVVDAPEEGKRLRVALDGKVEQYATRHDAGPEARGLRAIGAVEGGDESPVEDARHR
jgi:hypothetical protein